MAVQFDEYTAKIGSKYGNSIWFNLLKNKIKQEPIIDNALAVHAKGQN